MLRDINKNFSKLARASVLAAGLATVFAPTAFADSTVSAPAVEQTVPAQKVEAPAAKKMLLKYDLRNERIRISQAGAAEASDDRVAILVWGGPRSIQVEAYKAAKELAANDIPVAFIVGPDRFDYGENGASIEFYAEGVSARSTINGINHIATAKQDIYDLAEKTHNEFFLPERKDIASDKVSN